MSIKQVRHLEELTIYIDRQVEEFTYKQIDKPCLYLFYSSDGFPDADASIVITGLAAVYFQLPVGQSLPDDLSTPWSRKGSQDSKNQDSKDKNGLLFQLNFQHGDEQIINEAISPLLNHYLVSFRPLGHYRCSLFLPLVGLEEALGKPACPRYVYPVGDKQTVTDRQAAEAQAYLFFQPAMRDVLFDLDEGEPPQGLEALQEWRLDSSVLKGWQLDLAHDEADAANVDSVGFADVTLYRYFNGLYLLSFSLEPLALQRLGLQGQSIESLNDNPPLLSGLLHSKACWWQALVLADWQTHWRDIQALQMDHWLRFTRFVRLLYPSFREQFFEKKIARLTLVRNGFEAVNMFDDMSKGLSIARDCGGNISPLVLHVLSAFYGASQAGNPRVTDYLNHYCDIYDDRLFVNVSYGLAGGAIPAAERERLFSLALYVDRSEDGWLDGFAYSPDYIKPRLKEDSLDIWQAAGTDYGYTDFSNVALGYGDYFNTLVGPVHVRFIYERMLVQTLFYRASLRFYSSHITQITRQLVSDTIDTSEVKQLRSEFIRFTNQYWFHHVTNQMQGKLIFSKQQQALELEAEYAFIKDELERTDEFLETRRDIAMQKQSERWTVLATIVAVFALWFSLLPYLADPNGLSSWDEKLRQTLLDCCLSKNWVDVLWIFIPPTLTSGVIIGIFKFVKKSR